MKKLLSFLHTSFCDATGRPDAKLLTVFAIATCVIAVFPIGWVTGKWVPEYIYSPTLLFLAAGLGIDAFVTARKITADAPPALPTQVKVDNAENVNA